MPASAPADADAAPLILDLPGPAATDAMGAALAALLRPGDTVLLSGPVGAGKSHLARATIRARFGAQTEVPSPTFTLVQTYGTADADEVWHADLYRLAAAADLEELGLDAAFGRAICLVEWPERLGTATPPGALRIALVPRGQGRRATVTGGRDGLAGALAEALRGG